MTDRPEPTPAGGPIVAGLDGTGRAARAFGWARTVAEAADRELVAVRVYQVGDFAGGPDSAASAALEQLDEWVSDAAQPGHDSDPPDQRAATTMAVSGHPGPALVETAEFEHASLLVIGAPHVGAVAPHTLGRVVHHVAFRSPVPVAVVRGLGGPVSTAPLLIGVDPDDCNLDLIYWAFDTATHLGVPLEVVAASGRSKSLDRLERLLEDLVVADGPMVELFDQEGEPATVLMERAEEIEASIIAVGQKRRHNIGGRVMGRVPSTLLYRSRTPVVLLPH